jgi:DNA-binding NarL/FixJ family response regulator
LKAAFLQGIKIARYSSRVSHIPLDAAYPKKTRYIMRDSIVPLIERGMTNKEIANELNLSEQTVKNHIHGILRKMGVEDRLSVIEAIQTQTLGL